MTKSSALSLKGLDLKTRERLEVLCDKEVGAIGEADMDSLFARREYLSSDQKKEFGITEASAKKRI